MLVDEFGASGAMAHAFHQFPRGLPSAGYPRSVTSGQGSSWRLSLPGQLPLAVIPLIALKLAGIIGWSWWWVLAPLWSSVVIFIALIGGFLLLLIGSQRPQI